MDRLQGSMEALSALQITEDMKGLDTQSKSLLQYAEVLAVILRDTIAEYKGYSWKEVAGFIEVDSITSTMEVSPGRTNTKIRSDATEYNNLMRRRLFSIWRFGPGIHRFPQKIYRSTYI